ncbi:MAG: OmpA family protein [Bacteroidia bacterium]|nr:OmpA family protein [Bacteroidia bacterium]MBT8228799.1 OmpA family protein [Bacteroidia bacterium]NNK89920.1 OmpA family protein [Saprospiraceae bacterium]
MKPGFLIFSLLISFTLLAQDELYKTELVLERVEGFAANDRIEDLLINKGLVWIASKKGIRSYNNSTYALDNVTEFNNAIAVAVGRTGDVYSAYADNSLYKNKQRIFKLPSDSIRFTDIEIFKKKIWIGTNKGLYVINADSGKLLDKYTASNSALRSDYISFTFYSKSHRTIWIGTHRGVIELSDNRGSWKTEYKKDKMIAATENREGLWLLSDKELYLMVNGREFPQGLKKGLFEGEINDLALDSKNNLYVASDILTRYNPYKGRLEKYGENLGLVSSKCLSLASDKKGALWLGTADAGLYRIFTDSIQIENMRITIIPESTIDCFGENNASLKIEVNGGQGPYKYMWSPVSLRGDNPTNLKSGNYSVTVEDILGNRKFSSVSIEDPAKLINTVLSTEAVSRAGKKDGKASIEPSGGTPPYSIFWDNGEEGHEAKKLNYGFNYLTITDANGCEIIETVNVEKPKLLPELDIAKITVGQTLQINNLFFQADSSAITDESYEVLNEVYDFMAENTTVTIEIGGHTNSIPPDEYCDRLSSSRAKTVAEFLYNRGLVKDRISYRGYGKRKPIASNETVQGRKKNQRVEIKILRLGD